MLLDPGSQPGSRMSLGLTLAPFLCTNGCLCLAGYQGHGRERSRKVFRVASPGLLESRSWRAQSCTPSCASWARSVGAAERERENWLPRGGGSRSQPRPWRVRHSPAGQIRRALRSCAVDQQGHAGHSPRQEGLYDALIAPRAEVSAFGEDGEGDDLDLWTVRCSGQHWEREAAVRFQHVGTSVFLSVTGEQYGSPIRGQHEVHGMSSANTHNTWKAMEGIFIKPSVDPSAGHDEL
ncbi:stromal cell-derived factor 2-like [Lynx pardinus]|uniref:Stromal cell-derived factor 2-like n=1 Tax=Lynx pardinus TaxID=191816 RepID=A0A485NVI0_LYNPA|nr:stromal cell-derived factor 2-like [Lynx pardinus]